MGHGKYLFSFFLKPCLFLFNIMDFLSHCLFVRFFLFKFHIVL